MTIVFQGHVERVELGADSKLDVHVQTPQSECGHTAVLRVPREAASHWLPGRSVSFTAYAFDSAKPAAWPTVSAEQQEASDEADRHAVNAAYAQGCKQGT